jgi:hypothetical protein
LSEAEAVARGFERCAFIAGKMPALPGTRLELKLEHLFQAVPVFHLFQKCSRNLANLSNRSNKAKRALISGNHGLSAKN